jgi:hypothetical protein
LVRFLLGGNNPILFLVYDEFLELGVTSVEQRFNFNTWPNKLAAGPVNVGVKGSEPWVTED